MVEWFVAVSRQNSKSGKSSSASVVGKTWAVPTVSRYCLYTHTLLHWNLVYPGLLGPGQFQIGKILIKPNFTGFFQELTIKHHYSTPAFLYCCVIMVPYWSNFQRQLLYTFSCFMLKWSNFLVTTADKPWSWMKEYRMIKVLVFLYSETYLYINVCI